MRAALGMARHVNQIKTNIGSTTDDGTLVRGSDVAEPVRSTMSRARPGQAEPATCL